MQEADPGPMNSSVADASPTTLNVCGAEYVPSGVSTASCSVFSAPCTQRIFTSGKPMTGGRGLATSSMMRK